MPVQTGRGGSRQGITRSQSQKNKLKHTRSKVVQDPGIFSVLLCSALMFYNHLIMGIREIAQESGVSPATVSRVLNNTKRVSPELKEKVLRAVQRQQFKPNAAAQSMVLKKNNTIALVLPKVSTFFHQSMQDCISDFFEKKGYRLIVCNVDESESTELSYFNLFLQRAVDGILLMHETNAHPQVTQICESMEIPLVACCIIPPHPKIPTIRIDDYQAAYDGASRLIELGHRNTGFICGSGTGADRQRYNGFCQAHSDRGILLKKNQIEFVSYSMSSGELAAESLLRKNPKISAIFATSDEMALGVMKTARKRNLTIPSELSVLGFDGIELADFIHPVLSTITQPVADIALLSCRILLKMMLTNRVYTFKKMVPHTCLFRESVEKYSG